MEILLGTFKKQVRGLLLYGLDLHNALQSANRTRIANQSMPLLLTIARTKPLVTTVFPLLESASSSTHRTSHFEFNTDENHMVAEGELECEVYQALHSHGDGRSILWIL